MTTVMYNIIYEFFDLWKLDEWKKTKRYGTVTDRDGMVWDLYYPDTHPEGVCDHSCNLCESRCEVYQFFKGLGAGTKLYSN